MLGAGPPLEIIATTQGPLAHTQDPAAAAKTSAPSPNYTARRKAKRKPAAPEQTGLRENGAALGLVRVSNGPPRWLWIRQTENLGKN